MSYCWRTYFRNLDFEIKSAMLAKVNGCGKSELVSPQNMQILLVPNPVPQRRSP